MKKISIAVLFFVFFIVLWAGRYISKAPNITETIFYLGADSMLIGRTAFCNYPDEASNIPVIGSFISMDFEIIIKLNPDTVFFSDNLMSIDEKFLTQHHIGFVNIAMDDMQSVFSGMSELARIMGSDRDIDSFRNKALELTDSFSADSNALSVYIEIGSNPIVAAGRDSYIGSILEALNYSIIDFGGDYIPVSQETIIQSEPDVIIIMSNANDPSERSGWEQLYAVRNNNVIYLSGDEVDILSRPGPRLIKAIEILGTHLNEIDI